MDSPLEKEIDAVLPPAYRYKLNKGLNVIQASWTMSGVGGPLVPALLTHNAGTWQVRMLSWNTVLETPYFSTAQEAVACAQAKVHAFEQIVEESTCYK